MSINYQFGDVDAHGALIRAQAASLEAEHQAIIRDVLAAGDFGAVRVRWPAKSSSPSWAATSRSSTSRPTPMGKSPNRRGQHGLHRQRRWIQLGLTSTHRRRPHLDRYRTEPGHRAASRNQPAH